MQLAAMRMARTLARSLVAGAVAASAGSIARPTMAQGPQPQPPPGALVTVRAVHPEAEVGAVLDLFRGARASSPAAALSAWKRASAEPKRLGKVADALIALLNPHMVREYRALDEAEVAWSFDPAAGRWGWRARFPHDDGTLAVLGPVADLSGGGVEPPLGADRVDRFPGATLVLVAHGPTGVCAASSRAGLAAAVAAGATQPPASPIESGWLVQIDPAAEVGPSLAARRGVEAARGAGCRLISGRVRLDRATLLASWVGRFAAPTPALPPVDPAWLDAIPARGPLAAVGFAVDPRGESWAALFGGIDRVERVDPTRAGMAPARLRLALAARAGGVRLEADVWPHLIGVAGWVGATAGRVDRALLALHLDDAAGAARVAAGVRADRRHPDGPDEVAELGMVAARPLRLIRRGAAVYLAWGDRAWEETRAALDTPDGSARPWLGQSRAGARPSRVGAAWPDQLPGVPPGSPLAAALADSPPIRWAGANEGDRTIDEVWLDGLDATVRRFLDRLPLNPPPEP